MNFRASRRRPGSNPDDTEQIGIELRSRLGEVRKPSRGLLIAARRCIDGEGSSDLGQVLMRRATPALPSHL